MAFRAEALPQITGEGMGANSCPRENVVDVVRLRYSPVDQAGSAKRVSR